MECYNNYHSLLGTNASNVSMAASKEAATGASSSQPTYGSPARTAPTIGVKNRWANGSQRAFERHATPAGVTHGCRDVLSVTVPLLASTFATAPAVTTATTMATMIAGARRVRARGTTTDVAKLL